MMATSRTRSAKWSDLKARLTDLDRAGLIALLRDLHAASRDNQVCLHARFGLVDDVLGPYKGTIDRWLRARHWLLCQVRPDDEPLLGALVRMYAQALVAIKAVAEDQRTALIERLEDVCPIAHRIGDDIEDELRYLLVRHGFDDRP